MALNFKGKILEPQVFAICMAFDAFRVCLFGKPQHFTVKEIVAWIETCGAKS